MRIGIDASILGPRTRASGIGRYVTRLIERLPAIAPESTFVLVAPESVEPPRDLAPNVEWRRLPMRRLGKLSVPVAYLESLPRLARAARLDVFHAPTVHPRPSWPPVPRRLHCPLIVTIHDVIPLTFYARGPSRLPRTHLLYYRWNLRAAQRAAGVITVSESERATIARVLRMPMAAITAVHNGVDPQRAGGTVPLRGLPYVLFVGSLEARKNLVTLVRAYGDAVRRGLAWDLVIVVTSGSGPTQPIAAAIHSAAIWNRVRFIEGRTLADADLQALYRHAGMFVYPSLADSFGLPPLEAMAAGAPVVASGLPALREVLGDAALFIDGRSERQIAEAMLGLAADAVERARRASAGASSALRYSWDNCARQTLEVYRRAAGPTFARAGLPAELTAGRS